MTGPAPARDTAAMIVLIDNYDSFTFNLFHLLGEAVAEVQAATEAPLRLSPTLKLFEGVAAVD